MQVTTTQLAAAQFLKIYLDGLIAVSSLDHARATLDYVAQHSTDS